MTNMEFKNIQDALRYITHQSKTYPNVTIHPKNTKKSIPNFAD